MTSVKKILITGSSGYVGQHLLSTLARHGVIPASTNCQYEVYCAYNSLSTFESDLHQLCRGVLHPSIVKMAPFPLDFTSDLASEIQSVSSGNNIDVIIHLAALSSPFYCESHADEAWCINVPVKLLELNAPIVYMSTDQVYAGTKQYYEEEDETLPVNLYGRTKLAFERVLLQQLDGNSKDDPLLTKDELGDSTLPNHLSASKLKDLKPHPSSVILRSSLILGKPTPLAHGCKKGSFPSFLQFVHDRLQSNTETDYFTNEYRSMVHVRDVVKTILHFTQQALTSKSEGEEAGGVKIYNLGGSERVNRYELAVKIANYLKLDGACVNGVDRPNESGGVPSPLDISMNVYKLTKELGVERLDGLDDIIRSTFALD